MELAPLSKYLLYFVLSDLAYDMAGVIVERSSVLPAILPGSSHIASCSKEDQQLTFQALLHVFNRNLSFLELSNWTSIDVVFRRSAPILIR